MAQADLPQACAPGTRHTSAIHPLHQINSLGLHHTQGLPPGLSLVADQGPHLASSASTSARKHMLHGLQSTWRGRKHWLHGAATIFQTRTKYPCLHCASAVPHNIHP
jgi:hypothetical protein